MKKRRRKRIQLYIIFQTNESVHHLDIERERDIDLRLRIRRREKLLEFTLFSIEKRRKYVK